MALQSGRLDEIQGLGAMQRRRQEGLQEEAGDHRTLTVHYQRYETSRFGHIRLINPVREAGIADYWALLTFPAWPLYTGAGLGPIGRALQDDATQTRGGEGAVCGRGGAMTSPLGPHSIISRRCCDTIIGKAS